MTANNIDILLYSDQHLVQPSAAKVLLTNCEGPFDQRGGVSKENTQHCTGYSCIPWPWTIWPIATRAEQRLLLWMVE